MKTKLTTTQVKKLFPDAWRDYGDALPDGGDPETWAEFFLSPSGSLLAEINDGKPGMCTLAWGSKEWIAEWDDPEEYAKLAA